MAYHENEGQEMPHLLLRMLSFPRNITLIRPAIPSIWLFAGQIKANSSSSTATIQIQAKPIY
jgi:hypothetical protein